MTNRLVFFAPWRALCSDNRKFVRGYSLSKQYRESKVAIGDYATRAASHAGWDCTTAYVGLSVIVTEPDRRVRDLNWSKNLKDGISLSASIWADDAQVRVENWAFSSQPLDAEWAGAWVSIWLLNPEHYPPRTTTKLRKARTRAIIALD